VGKDGSNHLGKQASKQASKLDGAVFRKDRPSYQAMSQFTKDQSDMFDPNEETIACFCGD
jgi:hypothetical protein